MPAGESSPSSCSHPMRNEMKPAWMLCLSHPEQSKETHLLPAAPPGVSAPWGSFCFGAEGSRCPLGQKQQWGAAGCLGPGCNFEAALTARRNSQPPELHLFYTEEKLQGSNNSNMQDLCTYRIKAGFSRSSQKKGECNNFSCAAQAFSTSFYEPSTARLKQTKQQMAKKCHL